MTSGGVRETGGASGGVRCANRDGARFVHRMLVLSFVVLIVYAFAGVVNGVLTMAEVKRFHDHYFAARRAPASMAAPDKNDQSTLVALRWVNR